MTDVMMILRRTPYDGYWISSCGRVFSSRKCVNGDTLRELSPTPDYEGYLGVQCVVGERGSAKPFRRRVHQLSCETFHGPKPGPEYEVRHLDGSRTNNAAENLAWGTKKQNGQDRISHGSPRSFRVITDDDVREARRLYESGVGPTEIHRILGIGVQNAYMIGSRKSRSSVPDKELPA